MVATDKPGFCYVTALWNAQVVEVNLSDTWLTLQKSLTQTVSFPSTWQSRFCCLDLIKLWHKNAES